VTDQQKGKDALFNKWIKEVCGVGAADKGLLSLVLIAAFQSIWEAAAALDQGEREAEPLRCKGTGNPCGSDTWAVGHECSCGNCQKWLAEFRRAYPPPREETPAGAPATTDEDEPCEASPSIPNWCLTHHSYMRTCERMRAAAAPSGAQPVSEDKP